MKGGGWFKIGVVLGIVSISLSSLAQMTEEQKRELFLKAREDIRVVPSPATTPRPKPRPAATPRPSPKATPKPAPKATPRPASRPSTTPSAPPEAPDDNDIIPLEEEIDRGKKSPDQRPSPTRPTPTPSQPSRQPAPQATPPAKRGGPPPMEAPISIEKSGLQEDQGYEPPPKKSGGGGWFKRYRYLTPAIRKAIDQAPIKKGRWRYIIIHNSGTRQGNARIFNNYHLKTRKMQNGLAYHFVIGNGNSSGDGEIEIGSRWTRQINGGHVASDYLNNIALGICFVGDLNRDRPTAAQLAALEELVDYLRNRVGKIKGKPAAVRGHKQINPKPTDCPGDRFDLRWLRRRFGW